MRNYIWKLIQKIFSQELASFASAFYVQKEKDENIRRTQMNYPLGTKIISQSNEPDELLVATVISHELIHHGIMLMVENAQGQRFTLFNNAPALWTKEREAALRKLSWDERWNVMGKNFYVIDKKTKQRKETSDYRNNRSQVG